jgi:hypothetical protein
MAHMKLLMAALLLMSVQTFAQVCEVELVDTQTNQIIKTFRTHGDLSRCLEGMKDCRKSIRLEYSKNTEYPLHRLDCIRINASNPATNSYPDPNPILSPRPALNPQNGVTVYGLIGNETFHFSARDASELYYNCLTDIRRMHYGPAQELFFSANNNRFVSAQTSGRYNDTQICSILEQEARRSDKIVFTDKLQLIGSFERTPFKISALDRGSLLNECLTVYAATQQGSTDELIYSLNGATFQRLTTTTWWRTPAQAYKAMLIHMDSEI